MKKLTALVLSVGMLFSLTACGSKVSDDALDALEAAIQNVADMKSADYSMNVDMEQDQETVALAMKGTYNFETANPQLSMLLDLSAKGMKQENFMSIYLDKDAMYMNMMDIQKQKTPLKDSLKGMPSMSFDKETLKIPKDKIKPYLKEASLKGDVLTIEFDAAKMNEEVTKQAAKNPLTASASKTKIKTFKAIITLKNKQIAKAEMTFEGTVADATGKEKDMKAKITLAFENVGSKKQVVYPKDLSTYVEQKKVTNY